MTLISPWPIFPSFSVMIYALNRTTVYYQANCTCRIVAKLCRRRVYRSSSPRVLISFMKLQEIRFIRSDYILSSFNYLNITLSKVRNCYRKFQPQNFKISYKRQ